MKINQWVNRLTTRIMLLLSLATLAYCQNEQLAGEITTLGYCHNKSPYYSAYADSAAPLRPTGSATDPYVICTAADLEQLSSEVAAGETFSTKYFEQRSDIDFSGTANFTPIGSSSTLYFAGSYDGGGYTISNLTISLSGTDNVGMFGYVVDANLSNIILDAYNITGNDNTGGLVGSALDSASIEECQVKTGNVTGDENVGGLIGRVEPTTGSLTVSKNKSSANISATRQTGGLIGFVEANGGDVTIFSNTANASLTSSEDTGGLLGRADNQAFNTLTIALNFIDTNITATGSEVGGMAGIIQSDSNSQTIVSSNAIEGNFSADSNLGGIVGLVRSESSASIEFSANYTTVNINSPSSAIGIIGAAFGNLYLNAGNIDINSVYALGLIVTSSSYSIRAFIGRASTSAGGAYSVSNCYYQRAYYSHSGTPTSLNNSTGGTQVITLEADMKAATGTDHYSTDGNNYKLFPSGTVGTVTDPWSEFTFMGTGYPTL